ncbi:cyclodeaminase [Roseivivax isoporae]|uniref:Multidrug DMT transporter permease n=1 Tax=Roseivivax isoporae LMG 25204 TaxID=1449351 RepID=X7FA22_9RHOB|nr:cyclodeaminase [Roseivivax isoporae]ETX29650.1 multidrug DMT transporter permease [Roseivivax isoporae LMG 25204]
MPHDIRIVTEAELRGVVSLDTGLVDVVEAAFAALDRGGVVMPPVMSMALEEAHGEVDVKTAYLPGFDGFAIKVSPGFFDNPARGLPSLNGLMILLSAETGLVQAVFLDNGYLTDLRTAAAGAVAARHLAPEEVTTAGVIGTGVQARLQIRAAHLVRPFERVLVWGRDPQKATACAADLKAELGIEAEVCTDAATLVHRAQLVVTTTPARDPVLRAEWLHPGLHVTAMGSDQEGKNELDPACLARADLYVADRAAQCALLGELRTARAAGLFPQEPVELGAVVAGAAPGRRDPRAITIADLTGTGAQDTAIACHVAARLGDAGTVVRA